MATEKPRFTITLNDELYSKVNEYQHSKRFPTQTKAIVDLIERGAEALGLIVGKADGHKKSASSITDEAQEMALKYDGLDYYGKQAVRAVISVEVDRLTDSRPDLSVAALGGNSGKGRPNAELDSAEVERLRKESETSHGF